MKNEPTGAGGVPLLARSIAFVVICRSRICLGSTGGYRRAHAILRGNAMKRNVLKVATIAIFSCSGSRTDQLGCLSDGLGSRIKREAANEDFSEVLSAVGAIVLVALFTSLVASPATPTLLAEVVHVITLSPTPAPTPPPHTPP